MTQLSNQKFQRPTLSPTPDVTIGHESWVSVAFWRMVTSLRFPSLWWVLAKAAGVTFLGFILLMPLLGVGTMALLHGALPDAFSFGVGSLLGGVAGYFLFPLFFPLISLLFIDAVAGRVEQHYYPTFSKPIQFPFWQAVPHALRFLLLAITLNLLLLPVYLITAGLAAPLYFVLNSYLYGREYAEMLLQRHLPPQASITLRRHYRTRFWLAGIMVMALFTAPGLNLFAPILATLWMVHVVHGVLSIQ